MRGATVAVGDRNARAISSVVRPATMRRVSATRASVDSTGWQQMNTRRSRSSSIGLSIAASRSGVSSVSISRPISSVLRSRTLLRRIRSIARCLAVAMSQAPGLSGTPDSGHCSRAATSASWARSSARPTSRTTRTRPAISRADSIRQTASIARCASATAIRSGVALGLRAHALLALPHLGRELVAKVLGLEDLADLDLRRSRHRVRAALDPLDRLLERLGLHQPEAGDELLGLGERAVDDGPVAAGKADACALRAGMEPLAREHHTRLHQLLVVGVHGREELLARHGPRLALLRGLHHHHESRHRLSPCVELAVLSEASNGGRRNR